PIQSRMLRQINAFNNREELLSFVATLHAVLDPINLVTCVYRLAHMFSSNRSADARAAWKAELMADTTFQLLLGTVHSQLLTAHSQLLAGQQIKGLDARCVSNLIWAIVKLELVGDTNPPLRHGHDIVATSSPLVLKFLDTASSQGLANLLWSYSKMRVAGMPPVEVMMAIMQRMTHLLSQPDAAATFDAQALSNSVWALAHMRSSLGEWDQVVGQPGSAHAFLDAVAATVVGLLIALPVKQPSCPALLQAYMTEREKRFSCQALVNIVWGFATILGDECVRRPAVRQLFSLTRREAVTRLHATASALHLNQPWVHRLAGGLNCQALSNLIFAFDRAGLLDGELLNWVFNVAALRLNRLEHNGFKAQELCMLMRAAHQPIAQPWGFLSKLDAALQARPQILAGWSAPDLLELHKALLLLRQFKQQQALQQQTALQNQAIIQQQLALTQTAAAQQALAQQQQTARLLDLRQQQLQLQQPVMQMQAFHQSTPYNSELQLQLMLLELQQQQQQPLQQPLMQQHGGWQQSWPTATSAAITHPLECSTQACHSMDALQQLLRTCNNEDTSTRLQSLQQPVSPQMMGE
ncbi:hypothetical protein V8C86DRAFT_1782152, partial [Haematococcus lacustris]